MKAIAIAAIIAGLAASAAQAQPVTTGGGNVCIRTNWIDHTKVPDNRTILFYMRDSKIWQTRLSNECPLLNVNGFIYSPTPTDEICGNLQSIRVVSSGAVCMMGPLVPYEPPSRGS